MDSCGYRTGVISDPARSNWSNDGNRPIAWSVWYPTTEARPSNAPTPGLFDLGSVVHGAALAEGPALPVVLLSHGTGGTAETLGWLAGHLARAGYVVIGANHHGNTAVEPYRAEGFICWWERAADLSLLLDHFIGAELFQGRLDLTDVCAVGFSLGCHSVLALAGGRTSMVVFDAWRVQVGFSKQGPPEFPEAEAAFADVRQTSVAAQQSWDRQGEDMSDPRVRAIVSIAPPPPVRSLTATSVAQVRLPHTIVTGGADAESPYEHCAAWLLEQNAAFTHHDMGRHVGHYTFVGQPSDPALAAGQDLFVDHPEVNRSAVHAATRDIVTRALM